VDNVRVRLKLRDNEFEAEGPEGLVRQHLQEFKGLLGNPAMTAENGEKSGATGTSEAAALMFQADPVLKTLTLRILPSTDQGVLQQTANTLLLVLLGFQEALNAPKVSVLAATLAIRKSGLVEVQRLSNAFLKLQKEGLAMKTGRGKGTTYQLTSKGQNAARHLVQKTLGRAGL
jgi:hypothetical protein